MIFFKILWVIDAIAALIIFYFFFVGLADSTVAARNMGAWLMLITGVVAILLGSIWLKNHHYPTLAFGSLCIIAVPALFFLLYILIALFGNQRFN